MTDAQSSPPPPPPPTLPWTAAPAGSLCEMLRDRRLFVRWPARAKGLADSVWVPAAAASPGWLHKIDNTSQSELRVVAKDLTAQQCTTLACLPTAEARALAPLLEAGNALSVAWLDLPPNSLAVIVTSEGSVDSTGYLVLRGPGLLAQWVGATRLPGEWTHDGKNARRGRVFVLAANLSPETRDAMRAAGTTANLLALIPVATPASRAGQVIKWSDSRPGDVLRSRVDGREFLIADVVTCYELALGDKPEKVRSPASFEDDEDVEEDDEFYVLADNLSPEAQAATRKLVWPPDRWDYLIPSRRMAENNSIVKSADMIAHRACWSMPPEQYTGCVSLVAESVSQILGDPVLVWGFDENGRLGGYDSVHRRRLAAVGVHLWTYRGSYFGWWGRDVHTTSCVSDLLEKYLRGDTWKWDTRMWVVATLGMNHRWQAEEYTEAGVSIVPDTDLIGAWQVAEFVGRVRAARCADGVQHTVRPCGWADGLLVVPNVARTVTDGPWPVCPGGAGPNRSAPVALYFEHPSEPESTHRLRIANFLAAARAERGTVNLSHVRRCT